MGRALCLRLCAKCLTRTKFDGASPVFDVECLHSDEALDNEEEPDKFQRSLIQIANKKMAKKSQEVPKQTTGTANGLENLLQL